MRGRCKNHYIRHFRQKTYPQHNLPPPLRTSQIRRLRPRADLRPSLRKNERGRRSHGNPRNNQLGPLKPTLLPRKWSPHGRPLGSRGNKKRLDKNDGRTLRRDRLTLNWMKRTPVIGITTHETTRRTVTRTRRNDSLKNSRPRSQSPPKGCPRHTQ